MEGECEIQEGSEPTAPILRRPMGAPKARSKALLAGASLAD